MKSIKKIEQIQKACKKYDRNDYPGIAIAVVDHQELIYKKGYGIANLEYQIPIDENTVFHACSMTKQFTATCIALLIEQGKISLDEDVREILPRLNVFKEKLTVAQLLYMTNGMKDVYDTANYICGIREDEGITKEEFWKYLLAGRKNEYEAGEKWSYGNTGYFLLGEIIEAITKKSLSQFADEFIFQSLGMIHTMIRDDHTKLIPNRAIGYSDYEQVHSNDKYPRYTSRNDQLSINQDNVEVGGAGQLWTTINDLLLWNQNFYDNKLGKQSKELISFLTTSGTLNDGTNCGYGCGLFLDEFHGHQIVYHGGWAGGYSAYYAFLPELKSSVILLGNHTNFEYEFGFQSGGITEEILTLFTDDAVMKPKKQEQGIVEKTEIKETSMFVNEIPLEYYEGRYQCEALGFIYRVTKEENELYLQNDNLHNNAVDLRYIPIATDLFRCNHKSILQDTCIKFYRDVHNKIDSFQYVDPKNIGIHQFKFLKIQ